MPKRKAIFQNLVAIRQCIMVFMMAASNNRGFGETKKNIIYYGMSKNHISVNPQILSDHLTILHIKIIFSL